MNPRSRRDFDEQLEWVLKGLPPMVHELIEKVPLHVEDYPSPEVTDRLGIEYLDDLCGLYTGIPIGDKSVTHSGTLPDVVTIYREGILAAAADRGRGKGTVPICRNGPKGAAHKWGLSPFSPAAATSPPTPPPRNPHYHPARIGPSSWPDGRRPPKTGVWLSTGDCHYD